MSVWYDIFIILLLHWQHVENETLQWQILRCFPSRESNVIDANFMFYFVCSILPGWIIHCLTLFSHIIPKRGYINSQALPWSELTARSLSSTAPDQQVRCSNSNDGASSDGNTLFIENHMSIKFENRRLWTHTILYKYLMLMRESKNYFLEVILRLCTI